MVPAHRASGRERRSDVARVRATARRCLARAECRRGERRRRVPSLAQTKKRRAHESRRFFLQHYQNKDDSHMENPLFCSVHSHGLSHASCVLKSGTQLLLDAQLRHPNRLGSPQSDYPVWNDSTSSFRYPCLVTTYSLSLSLPWYIARMSFGHSQLP